MLQLTAPHVQRRAASYYRRNGLDGPTLSRATRTIERALGGGEFLSRADLAGCLRRARLDLGSLPLLLLMMYTELEGIICSGPRRRKHHTYALLAQRVPAAPSLSRDEALATLTCKYFASHGPATIRDFVWWSGLSTADARRGLDINRARSQTIDGLAYWAVGPRTVRPDARAAYLLPVYDEYVVAYRDRAAVPHHATGAPGSHAAGVVTFHQAVVIGGQVAGTWKSVRQRHGVAVEIVARRQVSSREHRAIAEAAERYGRFLDTPVSLAFR
jgi:hypothetical protein